MKYVVVCLEGKVDTLTVICKQSGGKTMERRDRLSKARWMTKARDKRETKPGKEE